ncbi:hypothetical protein E2C01_037216 [Portunus trituberculatus]|uniref:Uncharacterized protein n=1 Tax=Portunus trituberculatus TaxID=210409 RepID=A0A5B7FE23_PORTR|nr:hypothetical protein [Portunus trituberculatus]
MNRSKHLEHGTRRRGGEGLGRGRGGDQVQRLFEEKQQEEEEEKEEEEEEEEEKEEVTGNIFVFENKVEGHFFVPSYALHPTSSSSSSSSSSSCFSSSSYFTWPSSAA